MSYPGSYSNTVASENKVKQHKKKSVKHVHSKIYQNYRLVHLFRQNQVHYNTRQQLSNWRETQSLQSKHGAIKRPLNMQTITHSNSLSLFCWDLLT